MPPTFSISLHSGGNSPSRHFFNWLAAALKISDRDAVIRFNDFAFDIRKQLNSGSSIEWRGIGTLKKVFDQEISLEPEEKTFGYETPVVARKVIRENAEHIIRVGEEEKTSVEMLEYFHPEEVKKDYWWAWALAIGIVAIIFLGWLFSEKGMKLSTLGSGKKIEIQTTSPSYQEIK